MQIRHNPLSGGYCGEVPPLPIPNREVKLTCADGTAMQCGRVGSRLLLSRASDFERFLRLFCFLLQIICFHAAFLIPTDVRRFFAGLFVFYSIISFAQILLVNLDYLYYVRELYIMKNPEQCSSGLFFHSF